MHQLSAIWRPAAYHGSRMRPPFFEGWYFKSVSRDLSQRWAFIPGIYKHRDPALSHAFIQVLDGMTGDSTYHRFPVEAFQASPGRFDITVGENHFTAEGMHLAIDRPEQQVHGDVTFSELVPWPVKLLSPGIMGWYSFVPFMQCYHGVLGLDHALAGHLEIDGTRVDLTGGRGYLEKDWGRTFPLAYIWMQTNHFAGSDGAFAKGTCLSASLATIPWLTTSFPGYIVGLYHDGTLYRFTTYLNARVERLVVTEDQITWHLSGNRRVVDGGTQPFRQYRIEINANRASGGILAAPELTGMVERIVESMTSQVEVRLLGVSAGGEETVIFNGTSTATGLEVAGPVVKLVSDLSAGTVS